MTLKQLVSKAKDKTNFKDLEGFIRFCKEFLEYISDNLQATIISQNENNYCFYQYNRSGNFQILRPINTNLMYDYNEFTKNSFEFIKILKSIKTINKKDKSIREIINNSTYTKLRSNI